VFAKQVYMFKMLQKNSAGGGGMHRDVGDAEERGAGGGDAKHIADAGVEKQLGKGSWGKRAGK
jgi:hypothetical protein